MGGLVFLFALQPRQAKAGSMKWNSFLLRKSGMELLEHMGRWPITHNIHKSNPPINQQTPMNQNNSFPLIDLIGLISWIVAEEIN